jgi:hypothetical protein
MTSKDVDKLIRAEVWPFVRAQGFVVSGRTARRWRADAIDVINFQSYSDHVAAVHGSHHVKPTSPKPPRRRSLNPFGHRPLAAPTGTFEIAKDGSNARECVIDARAGVEQQALPQGTSADTAGTSRSGQRSTPLASRAPIPLFASASSRAPRRAFT